MKRLDPREHLSSICSSSTRTERPNTCPPTPMELLSRQVPPTTVIPSILTNRSAAAATAPGDHVAWIQIGTAQQQQSKEPQAPPTMHTHVLIHTFVPGEADVAAAIRQVIASAGGCVALDTLQAQQPSIHQQPDNFLSEAPMSSASQQVTPAAVQATASALVTATALPCSASRNLHDSQASASHNPLMGLRPMSTVGHYPLALNRDVRQHAIMPIRMHSLPAVLTPLRTSAVLQQPAAHATAAGVSGVTETCPSCKIQSLEPTSPLCQQPTVSCHQLFAPMPPQREAPQAPQRRLATSPAVSPFPHLQAAALPPSQQGQQRQQRLLRPHRAYSEVYSHQPMPSTTDTAPGASARASLMPRRLSWPSSSWKADPSTFQGATGCHSGETPHLRFASHPLLLPQASTTQTAAGEELAHAVPTEANQATTQATAAFGLDPFPTARHEFAHPKYKSMGSDNMPRSTGTPSPSASTHQPLRPLHSTGEASRLWSPALTPAAATPPTAKGLHAYPPFLPAAAAATAGLDGAKPSSSAWPATTPSSIKEPGERLRWRSLQQSLPCSPQQQAESHGIFSSMSPTLQKNVGLLQKQAASSSKLSTVPQPGTGLLDRRQIGSSAISPPLFVSRMPHEASQGSLEPLGTGQEQLASPVLQPMLPSLLQPRQQQPSNPTSSLQRPGAQSCASADHPLLPTASPPFIQQPVPMQQDTGQHQPTDSSVRSHMSSVRLSPAPQGPPEPISGAALRLPPLQTTDSGTVARHPQQDSLITFAAETAPLDASQQELQRQLQLRRDQPSVSPILRQSTSSPYRAAAERAAAAAARAVTAANNATAACAKLQDLQRHQLGGAGWTATATHVLPTPAETSASAAHTGSARRTALAEATESASPNVARMKRLELERQLTKELHKDGSTSSVRHKLGHSTTSRLLHQQCSPQHTLTQSPVLSSTRVFRGGTPVKSNTLPRLNSLQWRRPRRQLTYASNSSPSFPLHTPAVSTWAGREPSEPLTERSARATPANKTGAAITVPLHARIYSPASSPSRFGGFRTPAYSPIDAISPFNLRTSQISQNKQQRMMQSPKQHQYAFRSLPSGDSILRDISISATPLSAVSPLWRYPSTQQNNTFVRLQSQNSTAPQQQLQHMRESQLHGFQKEYSNKIPVSSGRLQRSPLVTAPSNNASCQGPTAPPLRRYLSAPLASAASQGTLQRSASTGRFSSQHMLGTEATKPQAYRRAHSTASMNSTLQHALSRALLPGWLEDVNANDSAAASSALRQAERAAAAAANAAKRAALAADAAGPSPAANSARQRAARAAAAAHAALLAARSRAASIRRSSTSPNVQLQTSTHTDHHQREMSLFEKQQLQQGSGRRASINGSNSPVGAWLLGGMGTPGRAAEGLTQNNETPHATAFPAAGVGTETMQTRSDSAACLERFPTQYYTIGLPRIAQEQQHGTRGYVCFPRSSNRILDLCSERSHENMERLHGDDKYPLQFAAAKGLANDVLDSHTPRHSLKTAAPVQLQHPRSNSVSPKSLHRITSSYTTPLSGTHWPHLNAVHLQEPLQLVQKEQQHLQEHHPESPSAQQRKEQELLQLLEARIPLASRQASRALADGSAEQWRQVSTSSGVPLKDVKQAADLLRIDNSEQAVNISHTLSNGFGGVEFGQQSQREEQHLQNHLLRAAVGWTRAESTDDPRDMSREKGEQTQNSISRQLSSERASCIIGGVSTVEREEGSNRSCFSFDVKRHRIAQSPRPSAAMTDLYSASPTNSKKPAAIQSKTITSLGVPSSLRVPALPFTWKTCRNLLRQLQQPADTFTIDGELYRHWQLSHVPTIGVAENPRRQQRMYRGRLKSGRGVFVKQVPASVWRQQWRQQQRFQGQFLCDGENYVGEAAASAFLTEYHPYCAAPLLAVLTDSGSLEDEEQATQSRPEISEAKGVLNSGVQRTHQPPPPHINSSSKGRQRTERVVLVFQLFGQSDLLDFVEANKPMAPWFKRKLQLSLVLLLHALHSAGLAHLDLTPENILVHSMVAGCVDRYISANGSSGKGVPEGFPLQLRLCDFAKATPLFNWSNLQLPASLLTRYPSQARWPIIRDRVMLPPTSTKPAADAPPFISCEPTIGKGPYMPPEAWKALHVLRSLGITSPFAQIKEALLLTGRPPPPLYVREGAFALGASSGAEAPRKGGVDVSLVFFDVRKADIYMLGVLLFSLWADGAVWRASDVQQDEQYASLVKGNYCFSAFPECADWPAPLLDLIRGCIQEDPDRRLLLDQVLQHSWWSAPLNS
ncbi:FIK kinase [Cyclospora cayetanensis]|uniref:non-specific serine/threonine protein kinase n=1 Tax=Cyclospora cayetanensis TaxID=88456 RepID=A0A1D3CYA5_9EIME|nr:FIK kinase [Cyclospora cayetanensis]